MKKKKDVNKIEKFLEIPKELVTGQPRLLVTGFEEMIIENYKGILEYEDFYIRIATFTGVININGFNLVLNQMKDETVVVHGKINSIDWENDIVEGE